MQLRLCCFFVRVLCCVEMGNCSSKDAERVCLYCEKTCFSPIVNGLMIDVRPLRFVGRQNRRRCHRSSILEKMMKPDDSNVVDMATVLCSMLERPKEFKKYKSGVITDIHIVKDQCEESVIVDFMPVKYCDMIIEYIIILITRFNFLELCKQRLLEHANPQDATMIIMFILSVFF